LSQRKLAIFKLRIFNRVQHIHKHVTEIGAERKKELLGARGFLT
jgi:hypothetical protein